MAFSASAPMSSRSEYRNTLLSLLSDEDMARLLPDLEPVDWPKGFVFAEREQTLTHAYLPESGIGSVVAISPEGLQAEVGLYGRDGMTPVNVVFGQDRSVHRHLVQVAGAGHRIPLKILADAMAQSQTMRDLLLRFAHVSMMQANYTALSNAVHPVDERLARWILMCHDRVDGNELELTHEFLSIMLAVRRPSVTSSLHVLEGNRFIRAERGRIIIRDRKALEEFAGDAYGQSEAEYRRVLGRF